ncbi:hypothetical protein HY624_00490 [Candidatus Uhrbacteria bacterium]|nr:hypothetical protein [Candidatus Uhrbacteria bacterium]
MSIHIRRFIVPFAVAALLLAFAPFAHAKGTKPKVQKYVGGGSTFNVPQGWVAVTGKTTKEDKALFREFDSEIIKKTFTGGKLIAAFVNKQYEQAIILFATDSDIKINKKTVSVKEYGQQGKIMGDIKIDKLPAVQWTVQSSDGVERRFTSVIKNDLAYTIYLYSGPGVYDKEKGIRDAYAKIVKSFQFATKAKAASKKKTAPKKKK